MFSADFGGGPLGEFFAAEHPTWEEYGRSGEPFFPQTGTSITTAEQTPYAGPGAVDILQNWGTFLPPVQIGTGGAARAAIAEQLRAAQEQALAGADYISDIPREIGEAGGEFVAELGAGVGTGVESVLTGVTAPITAIPGDLFEGIPTWVPLLGAAYLLTRK